MAEGKDKEEVEIPAGKDFTKGKKPGKNKVKVQFLDHSALKKNKRGRNPGDIAFVDANVAKSLIESKKAKKV